MTGDRWAVLGLAPPRVGWFSDVAQWSMSASIPIDFVKCVTPAEVRARLLGGRPFSALLVSGDSTGFDRDLVAAARAAGAATIVVGATATRDWDELGVAAVLPAALDRADLVAALRHHATPLAELEPIDPEPLGRPAASSSGWCGRLVAVTGTGGAGASITAMAVAQALGSEASNRSLVVLVDFALRADQAMYHDALDVVPGVQELVEAHRSARLPSDEIRALAFDVVDRAYHLLLGLRNQRDWTALRPAALHAALEGLLHSYRLVVADVDCDVEGERETGSLDIEDRNVMARSVLGRADVVVVVAVASTGGLFGLTRSVRSLVDFGVDPSVIVPVFNHAPRARRRRAEFTSALAALLAEDPMEGLANPVFVPERPDVEPAVRDGRSLPSALTRSLQPEIDRRLAMTRDVDRPETQPVPIAPGTVGSWTGGA